MTSIASDVVTRNDVVANAERLRRRAKAIIDEFPNRYPDLTGQPSGWCVVTEKGWFSRAYSTLLDEDQLRENVKHGHRVVLTLGMVANPCRDLSPSNHAAVVSFAEPKRHTSNKLARITMQAKKFAASALYR